jgi:carbon-monoxide dehydrogenase medium subunit
MRDFEFESPRTVAEAVDLLSRHNGSAKVLAGGTDLIDQIRNGRFAPKVVVDLKKIPDVNVLECGPRGLRLGAAVPCYRICQHAEIARNYSAIVDSVQIIGGIQIQSRATVGGNLCNSGPAADATPSLIALGGTVVMAGPDGTREVPVESFCTGPGKNVLRTGEFVVEIRLPPPAPPSGSSYLRFIPRNEMDIAVVGVGAAVTLDSSRGKILSARIGLGAVAPTPLLAADAAAALIGQPIGDAALDAAANAARAICSPIDDMRGTREFRIHVTGVLVKRAVSIAIERARKS